MIDRRRRPRPVLCVNEHEHRDRALADAVDARRASRFAGETRDARPRARLARRAPLPDDEEWRIDWVKFYYGLDLADAFRATGDRRYLDAWERLVASFILQVPPDHDPSEVTARRILNWIYAWQRLPEASIGAGARREPARPGAPRPRHAHARAQPPHARALRAAAAALALPDLIPASTTSPSSELHDNLLADFGADGVHRERSTHYHMIALRSFVGARENCRRFDVALPRALRRAARPRPASSRTTCAAPTARSRRSRTATPATTPRCSSSPRACSRARTSSTRPPAPRASRTAATSSSARASRYLIFDCGPLGDGGHGHYDALSVEAWAGERALVLDPGRFTYAEGEPNLRHWFRGTAAHNTVTVDGADQTPYARSRSSLPSAEATFLGRDDRATASTSSTARSARPSTRRVHRRRVIFVDGAYWLIEDVLTGTAQAPLRPALALRARGHTAVHAARQGRAQRRDRGRLDLAARTGSATPRRS